MYEGVTLLKEFSKAFCEQTTGNDDSYPIYRRNERCKFKKVFMYDNRWIVSYNPFLSKNYNVHINVEIASTVKAVKYLYKYVHKRSDSIWAQMLYSTNDSQEQQVATLDEIRQYIDGRYVSTSEALWWIYGFSMHSELPAVCQLAIHLNMPQPVYLRQNMTADEALAAARISEER